MKIEILLRNLRVKFKDNSKGYLSISIGDYVRFQSAEEINREGVYSFLQNNIIQIDKSLPQYIQVDFIIGQHTVARKSLFYSEALEKHEITLNPLNKSDHNVYLLEYQIKASQLKINSNGTSQYIPLNKIRRRKTLEEQIPSSIGQKGHIKVLQLGKITFNFARRLDIVVEMYYKTKDLIFWKKSENTIAFGVLLTLVVLFPKISILIFSLCLIFGKNYIIQKVERSSLARGIKSNLLPPQQNLIFLKHVMQLYCDAFESVNDFLREDDRTKIITIVQVICKFGVVVFLLSLIFSLQILLICAIWIGLMMTSNFGQRTIPGVWRKILHLNSHVDKVISNVSQSSMAKVLKANPSNPTQIVKQFYVYQYQRWWVGKQWVASHYSDQNKEIVIQPRKDSPFGWRWMNSWEVQYSDNTDSDGFEYANDLFKHHYDSSKALKTIRRRKWKRACKRQSDLNAPPMLKIRSQLYKNDYTKAIQSDRRIVSTNFKDKIA